MLFVQEALQRLFGLPVCQSITVENLSHAGELALPGDCLRITSGSLCMTGLFCDEEQAFEVSSWTRCCLPPRSESGKRARR